MDTYLLMLYVTLEQELAIRELFLQKDWEFCKQVRRTVFGPGLKYVTVDCAATYNTTGPDFEDCKQWSDRDEDFVITETAVDTGGDNIAETTDQTIQHFYLKNTQTGQEKKKEKVIRSKKRQKTGNISPTDSNEHAKIIIGTDKISSRSRKSKVPSIKRPRLTKKRNLNGKIFDRSSVEVSHQKDEDNKLAASDKIEEEKYKCSVCGREFANLTSLENHMINHKGGKPFECRECDMKFRWNCNLVIHMAKDHGKKSTAHIYDCESCDKSFIRRSDFVQHKRTHTREKPYKCQECGESFTQFGGLQKHKWKHGGERPHKCDYCGMSFNGRYLLQDHMWIHTGVKEHKCDQCNQSFSQRNNLVRHKKLHSGEGQSMCSICGMTFSQGYYLQRHMKTHGPKDFTCSQCGTSFMQKRELTKHLLKEHGVQTTGANHKPSQRQLCPICGKSVHKTNMKIHMRIHTGEKPYKCSLCNYVCSQSSSLNVHMVQHTGLKPHKCTLCSKSFSTVNALKLHVRTHTGERPFKCTECSKAFAQGQQLVKHLRIHSGERPYKCHSCGKAFTQKYNMRAHMKTVHGIIVESGQRDSSSSNNLLIDSIETDMALNQIVSEILPKTSF